MSQDSTKPGYKPIDAFDVSENNPDMLANTVRALQREVRDGFELWANRIMPALDKFRDALEDIGERLTRLEKDRDDIKDRVTALEQSAQKRRKAARK